MCIGVLTQHAKSEYCACSSVARCGVFMPNWLFFNAYGGEKIALGVVAGSWLFLTWPIRRNGGIYGIKTITRSATIE